MSSVNTGSRTARRTNPKTEEGTPAKRVNKTEQLKRVLNACLLWEDGFYVDGEGISTVLRELVPQVDAGTVANLATLARTEQKLRHAPLLIVYEMTLASKAHRALVASTLAQVIQRPDEITEFVAIYYKLGGGKRPLSKQVKIGLAAAFNKFNEYQLAKYNRDAEVKLADVMALVHPKPKDKDTGLLFAKLANKTFFPKTTKFSKFPVAKTYKKFVKLQTPDTWEVGLSTGENKADTFTRLIAEDKLGAMALLKNLRGMVAAGVDRSVIRSAIVKANVERVLPFRFITAAKYAAQFEPELEQAMFKCLADMPKLKGETALIVDTSPSMWQAKISSKSEMTRFDAAAALAILLREVCEHVNVYAFNNKAYSITPRRGFALRDELAKTQEGWSCGGAAVKLANDTGYDRIIVITDGQWHRVEDIGKWGVSDYRQQDVAPAPLTSQAYMVNIATERFGVGTSKWKDINGWSESILQYIAAEEGIAGNFAD
jgi:60 kDa SS-A/Ro ribonucleoprotein